MVLCTRPFGLIVTLVLLASSLVAATSVSASHLEELPPVPSPDDFPLEDQKESACEKDPYGPECGLLTESHDVFYTVLWLRENAVLLIWKEGNEAYNETGLPGVGEVRALLCDLDPAEDEGVVCLVAMNAEQWYWVSGPLIQLVADIAWNLVVFIATNAVDLVDETWHKNEENAEHVAQWATQTVPAWAQDWVCHATSGEGPGCGGQDDGQPPLLPPPPFPPQ